MMITSTTNKQVKFVNALVKKAKTRREEDLFVAEGPRICAEIPKENIRTLYFSETFSHQPEAKKMARGVSQVEVVSNDVFRALSDTQTPQGVLALVKQYHYTLEDLFSKDRNNKASSALFVILEHLQDPGNLGTILRAAEGAGVTGILMDKETVDIYSPKVVRSTMGSVLRVPFVITQDLPATLKAVKRMGVRIFAAQMQKKRSYDHENYIGPSAFLVGNEAGGLTKEVSDMADVCIHIPMLGKVESLNAAVAASLLIFEAARQRRN